MNRLRAYRKKTLRVYRKPILGTFHGSCANFRALSACSVCVRVAHTPIEVYYVGPGCRFWKDKDAKVKTDQKPSKKGV